MIKQTVFVMALFFGSITLAVAAAIAIVQLLDHLL